MPHDSQKNPGHLCKDAHSKGTPKSMSSFEVPLHKNGTRICGQT